MSLVYRPDIDGLRAIAVIGTVLFHLNHFIPGGFVGVDIFFVISGYLIIGKINHEIDTGIFSFLGFWKKRVLRILPALLAMVLCTSVAGLIICLPEDLAALGKQIVASSVGLSNFLFNRESGYFDGAAEDKPLLHTWSLGIEDQFYIFIPIILVLTRLKNLLLPGFFISSFFLSVVMVQENPTQVFYLLPFRAWEFLAGGTCLILEKRLKELNRFLKEFLAILGVMLIVYSFSFFNKTTEFPGMNAVFPVLGTALIIFSGSENVVSSSVNKCLSVNFIRIIGLWSYSLYLWHWPVLVYFKYFGLQTNEIKVLISYILVVLFFSLWSYYLIERPLRYIKKYQKKILYSTGLSSIGLCVIGLSFWFFNGFPSRLNEKAFAYWNKDRDLGKEIMAKVGFTGCSLSSFPDKVPAFGEGIRTDFIVWGDSHARSLAPGISFISSRNKIKSALLHRSGCPPLLGWNYAVPGMNSDQTLKFCQAAFNFIAESDTRVVILCGYWMSRLDQDVELEGKILNTCSELIKKGKKVVFIKNIPIYKFNIQKELVFREQWGLDTNCLYSKIVNPRYTAWENQLVKNLSKLGVESIDLSVELCDPSDQDCKIIKPFDEEGSLYSDSNHLSCYGSIKVSSRIEKVVKIMIPDFH